MRRVNAVNCFVEIRPFWTLPRDGWILFIVLLKLGLSGHYQETGESCLLFCWNYIFLDTAKRRVNPVYCFVEIRPFWTLPWDGWMLLIVCWNYTFLDTAKRRVNPVYCFVEIRPFWTLPWDGWMLLIVCWNYIFLYTTKRRVNPVYFFLLKLDLSGHYQETVESCFLFCWN